jgi:hypothetical protein
MEILMGLLGATLALMTVFFLYIGAVAVVLRLGDWLRPKTIAPKQGPNVSLPTH